MRAAIRPRLVNPDPFDDPGLFIHFAFVKRAILFDLGDLHALSPKDILKITHVFVSHTHVDHFIGFDHLLRICLGRDKIIHMFGPEGIIANTAGKLQGYSWNLLENYESEFGFRVTEVHEDRLETCNFTTLGEFKPTPREVVRNHGGLLLTEPDFTVEAKILDHGMPCLGFALNERFHVNILKARLEELGMDVGPWLREFKQSLYASKDWSEPFTVPMPEGKDKSFTLAELAEAVTLITPGQKIAYITDVAGHADNQKKILALAENADQLFIEASFADEDAEHAVARNHLTAGQAGELAKTAKARQMINFHISPRYQEEPELILEQARQAFETQGE
ncbi:ribonuclease Z [Desulfatibacillum aliphaticivorans]|uniref:Ribonuclease Z n=1 Tax=Desulfatibacillum aliphaticivorans TaxID=218208 RepID=B8FE64_DESAL|nr:MBL fold metallo-hydrolase [Desulfatibacillum aliphaticivorans]ACL06845.1 ribonuclease Z [Desulfatibacillum aliphaticivorans]